MEVLKVHGNEGRRLARGSVPSIMIKNRKRREGGGNENRLVSCKRRRLADTVSVPTLSCPQ